MNRLEHHELDLTVFKRSACQTIPSHPFDHRPILAEVFRRFFLRLQLCLHAAGLSQVSVRNVEKDSLLSLFGILFGGQIKASHALFLRESLALRVELLGSNRP
jgi:hypothetical protein